VKQLSLFNATSFKEILRDSSLEKHFIIMFLRFFIAVLTFSVVSSIGQAQNANGKQILIQKSDFVSLKI
jgi:hypothetical protein